MLKIEKGGFKRQLVRSVSFQEDQCEQFLDKKLEPFMQELRSLSKNERLFRKA